MFGVTCYEALYYRTPLLMLSREYDSSDSLQLENISNGACVDMGTIGKMTQQVFCDYLLYYYEHPEERYAMYDASTNLLDGHGVFRAAQAMQALS